MVSVTYAQNFTAVSRIPTKVHNQIVYMDLATEHVDYVIVTLYFILAPRHIYHSFSNYSTFSIPVNPCLVDISAPCLIITRNRCSNCHAKLQNWVRLELWKKTRKVHGSTIRTIRCVVYPLDAKKFMVRSVTSAR